MSEQYTPRHKATKNGVLASHTRATHLARTSVVAALAVGCLTIAQPGSATPSPTASTSPSHAAHVATTSAADRSVAVSRSGERTAPVERTASGVAYRTTVVVKAQRLAAPTRHRILGKRMMKRHGWALRQWRPLNKLWTKESGWRKHADNPYSSAYGIPQALVRTHKLRRTRYMTSARVQIRWGLNYIDDRYGSPRRAWRHSKRHGWY